MASLRKDYSIILFLRWLELRCPQKADELCPLRLKVSFVLVFLSCGGKHNNTENRCFQALLFHIRAVFQSVDLDIRRCWADFTRSLCVPMNMDDLLSSGQQRLELLKPEIHEVYTILSKSSRSALHGDSQASMKNLNFLLENIEDLLKFNAQTVAPVKNELEAAQKSLRSFRDLFGFTKKWCSKLGKLKNLIIHSEFLADKLSCLLYMCSVKEKMNDSMVNDMKMNLSSELENFSLAQRKVRQMYIKALKASKSAQDDVVVLGTLYSLQDNLLQLLDITPPSFTASVKDKFVSLHEHISAAIVEQNTDEKKLKIAVSSLQDIIKIAKEDCRKAYDTDIPKSWHMKTKFRRTNAQGMIRSLMRILEEIKSHSYGWPQISQFNVREKKMQSLIETFSNLATKQQPEHGELEIHMACLNDIRNEIESFLSSLQARSCSLWNHKLWLYMLIEEIRMIKKQFKYLQNQMMHDTSISKLHRKMNLQGKKTMNDYAEIFEDHPKRTGKQLSNGSEKPYSLPVIVDMRGIEDQSNNLDLIIFPQENKIKAVRLKTGFLKVFLKCKGMWHIKEANLKVLLTHINGVFQSADQDLQKLWTNLNIQTSPKEVWCLPMNLDCLLFRVLSMLQQLGPDIQGAYAVLMKSSSVISGISDAALMEIINILLENIELLRKCNTELIAPLKEEIEAVRKSLIFLRNFLGFTAKRCRKLGKLKDLLIHSEFLAGKISSLLYLCCENENVNDQMVNEMKMHISVELQKLRPTQPNVRKIYINALKASKSGKGNSNSTVLDEFVLGFLDSLRDDIQELSNKNLIFVASTQQQLLSLQEELKLFITFFTMDRYLEENSKQDQVFNSLLVHINVVIIEIGCIIYLLSNDENDEMKVRELNNKVSDLVAKADIRKIFDLYVPRSLSSGFPRTNGQGYIGSLFQNLNELLNNNLDLVAPLKHHIEIVRKELLSLKEDFGKIAEQPNQHDELRSHWNRFPDSAYQTEFIIDSFVIGGDPIYCHKLGLFIVLKEIKAIKIGLKDIKIKVTNETSVRKPSFISNEKLVKSNFRNSNVFKSSKGRLGNEMITNTLVIFEEEEKIREKLMRGSKKLHIISIVGMPGIGKTTLADTVFQNSSVTYHFHVRARCSVSQVYNKSRLLLEIVQQVNAESKQYCDDDDVDLMLYQSLNGRRYLILLDDLWNIQPWEDIKALFPDNENGSRIIFTSRFDDIATQAGLESIKFRLSPLPNDKSWETLQVKLFGNQSCPSNLVCDGYKIAANCKGVPLIIDLVAGVLRMKGRKEWKKVATSLMKILLEDPQGHCWNIVELSYQNLPDDLKPCFLYFAMFPEDADVPTRDLICLWIAEGFIKLEMGETRNLEDKAEDILNNLIRRSLVTVSKRGPSGGVIESRVHDLLHEFAISKAEEESFMLKILSNGIHDQWQEQYRLCIYPNSQWQFPESKPSCSRTRAFIAQNLPYNYVSPNFKTSKLLRVLYIREALCHYCPEMFTLIHLRFLAISTCVDSDVCNIIQNIHKLWNLETFIFDVGQYGESFRGPNENLLLDKICNMVRLRHFCFEGYIHIKYLSEHIWQEASFANLRTLYNLKASYEEDIEKILKLMPNLVELSVVFYNPDGDCYPFPKLDFLNKLESLKVEHEIHLDSCKIISFSSKITSFPPHLKSLVLSKFGMPWVEISEIGNLEYLEVLELKEGAFRGPIWDMIDGQFPRLKYLSLSDLDIEEWNASEDHLSCLEKLHVSRCEDLKELPGCLAEISTLQEIKLLNCSAAENAVKKIREEQEQMGNEQLVVDTNKDLWGLLAKSIGWS